MLLTRVSRPAALSCQSSGRRRRLPITSKRFFLESRGRRKFEVYIFITHAQDGDGGLDAAFTLVGNYKSPMAHVAPPAPHTISPFQVLSLLSPGHLSPLLPPQALPLTQTMIARLKVYS